MSLPTAPAPGSVRAVYAALTGIALVAGIAIALAHELSAPRVAEQRHQAIADAVLHVLPGAVAWQGFAPGADGSLAPLAADPASAAVYAGFDGAGRRVGFAVPAQGMGYQDRIVLLYGVDLAGRRLLGLRVLESRETPGLGARIADDPGFLGQFDGLPVLLDDRGQPRGWSVVRGARGPGEIDAITGATVSSAAVARIVSESLREGWSRLGALPAPVGGQGG